MSTRTIEFTTFWCIHDFSILHEYSKQKVHNTWNKSSYFNLQNRQCMAKTEKYYESFPKCLELKRKWTFSCLIIYLWYNWKANYVILTSLIQNWKETLQTRIFCIFWIFFELKHTAINLFNVHESDKILNEARKNSLQGHKRNDSKSNIKHRKITANWPNRVS